MLRCEICGRWPAKEMSFQAHQGFLIFRRQYSLSGTFCRDCALTAYAQARGITLRGMWFSPDALVLGTLGSLWDSAKLLDLPEEVKDEPWMFHKVACPKCRHATVATAGAADCENCKSLFLVLSCSACRLVHTVTTREPCDLVSITCRSCGHTSHAPTAARNTPPLLIPRALAEIAANLHESPISLAVLFQTLAPHSPLNSKTWDWVLDYFSHCCKELSVGQVLTGAIQHREFGFLRAAFSIYRELGNPSDIGGLCALLRHLGLDPEQFINPNRQSEAQEVANWHLMLEISADATLAEIHRAYQRLAKQFHPDFWHDANPADQDRASQKMKELNAAYEVAKASRSSTTEESAARARGDAERAERAKQREAEAQAAAKEAAERREREKAAEEAGAKEAEERRATAERQQRERERAPIPVLPSSASPNLGVASIAMGVIVLAVVAFLIGMTVERLHWQTRVSESSSLKTESAEPEHLPTAVSEEPILQTPSTERNNLPTAVSEPSVPQTASARGKYWSIGATAEEVFEIEGEPDRIFNEPTEYGYNIVWCYVPDDQVKFDGKNRTVVAWKNPKKSLAVTVNSKDAPPPLDPKAMILYDSTYDEVLRAIGMPENATLLKDGYSETNRQTEAIDRFDLEKWTYRYHASESEVTFLRGRVFEINGLFERPKSQEVIVASTNSDPQSAPAAKSAVELAHNLPLEPQKTAAGFRGQITRIEHDRGGQILWQIHFEEPVDGLQGQTILTWCDEQALPGRITVVRTRGRDMVGVPSISAKIGDAVRLEPGLQDSKSSGSSNLGNELPRRKSDETSDRLIDAILASPNKK